MANHVKFGILRESLVNLHSCLVWDTLALTKVMKMMAMYWFNFTFQRSIWQAFAFSTPRMLGKVVLLELTWNIMYHMDFMAHFHQKYSSPPLIPLLNQNFNVLCFMMLLFPKHCQAMWINLRHFDASLCSCVDYPSIWEKFRTFINGQDSSYEKIYSIKIWTDEIIPKLLVFSTYISFWK